MPIVFYDPDCSLLLQRATFGYVLVQTVQLHHDSGAVTDGRDDHKHPNRVGGWRQY